MMTILMPRDYGEYLEISERPPVHLLRIMPTGEMLASLVERSDVTNRQTSLSKHP
jgi:hypothetical protein